MKYIVWKPYWNYEKEEKWLNEMSAKGMALHSYSWCRYVFEDAPSGEYIYRIELLDHLPTHPENISYLRFLEESGIEHVTSYLRWIYLRKRAADGVFDLYSDIDSKIKHYRKVWLFWFIFTCAELCIGLDNVFLGVSQKNLISPVNLFMGLALTIVGLLIFFGLCAPTFKKIKRLKKEKSIRE